MAAKRLTRAQKEEANKIARKAAREAFNKNPTEAVRAYREQFPEDAEMFREGRNAAYREFYASHSEQERARIASYYEHVGDIKAVMHKDGSITRMRSMSEVYFFSMLEDEGLDYQYEVRINTPMGVYIADGYIPSLNIYVEVKADYYVRENQTAKIEYLRSKGYSIIMIDAAFINAEFGF